MTDPRPATTAVLWVLLVVSLVANSVISMASVPLGAHLVAGGVSALCLAGLFFSRQQRVR